MYYQVQTVSLELTRVAALFPSAYVPTTPQEEFRRIETPGDKEEDYVANTVAFMMTRHRTDKA